MIFFKKQHEEIAIGFLKRIDLLLRSGEKNVAGYSIQDGVETLALKIGGVRVEMKIEGSMWAYNAPQVDASKPDPNKIADESVEAVKEMIY